MCLHCYPSSGHGATLIGKICAVGFYEDKLDKHCYECTAGGTEFVDSIPLLVFLGLVAILLAAMAYKWYLSFANDEDAVESSPAVQWLAAVFARVTERYVKVLYATFQIISAAPNAMIVTMPPPFSQATEAMKLTSLNFMTFVPFDCVFPDVTYFSTFIFTMFLPLVLAAGLCLDFVVERFMITTNPKLSRREALRQTRDLKTRNVSYGLILSYLVLPGCVQTIFTMLNCETFESRPCLDDTNPACSPDADLVLAVDKSITCTEQQYVTRYLPLVYVFIAVYPVGKCSAWQRGPSNVGSNSQRASSAPRALVLATAGLPD